MNQPNKPPQEIQLNVNLKNKTPFKCDHKVDGKECGCPFFRQVFHLYYISSIEAGVPMPITFPQPIWACAKCGAVHQGAKPQ